MRSTRPRINAQPGRYRPVGLVDTHRMAQIPKFVAAVAPRTGWALAGQSRRLRHATRRTRQESRPAQQGKQIPKGLGKLTAALLGSEVLDWHRFKNRRQVASYTGLCPSEQSSGDKRKQGSINKHGNPRVRHQLVEAVWRLEQWQPAYPPLKILLDASGTRNRKRAAVAVARRLAIDLWRIETGQCSAQKLGLTLVKAAA